MFQFLFALFALMAFLVVLFNPNIIVGLFNEAKDKIFKKNRFDAQITKEQKKLEKITKKLAEARGTSNDFANRLAERQEKLKTAKSNLEKLKKDTYSSAIKESLLGTLTLEIISLEQEIKLLEEALTNSVKNYNIIDNQVQKINNILNDLKQKQIELQLRETMDELGTDNLNKIKDSMQEEISKFRTKERVNDIIENTEFEQAYLEERIKQNRE